MKSSFKICLVGAGNMGGAMLMGWLEGGIAPSDVTVIDPAPRGEMAAMLQKHDISAVAKAPEDYRPDVMIIAVKPQMMETVLPSLAMLIGTNTVSVSVAAGTTISAMEKHLGLGAIVRAMPNTPALLRKGITVCCANDAVSEPQRQRVDLLLKSIGIVEWVENEKLIDAVTAVSGSGPAYVFHLAEAMAAAGIEQGLTPELANKLARETIAGAGAMLSQLPEPSSTLRQNVTSPNGTTAAALSVLMSDGAMENLLSAAIAAARKRSEELAANS